MSMAHGHAGEENTDGCRTYECGFVWIEGDTNHGREKCDQSSASRRRNGGSGVYALSEMLKDEMFQKTGASLEIKKVLVRNVKKDRPGIPKEIMTDNWQEILEDEEIQLVIELMGGVEPARTYIVQALESRKTGCYRK